MIVVRRVSAAQIFYWDLAATLPSWPPRETGLYQLWLNASVN